MCWDSFCGNRRGFLGARAASSMKKSALVSCITRGPHDAAAPVLGATLPWPSRRH